LSFYELYFRFRDDVFLTTNLPKEEIENKLRDLNKSDPNIEIKWEGGKSANYLDVIVTVEIPKFRTKMFRKLAAQPYVLPFNSAHPVHIMRNIPYAAALRLTRICSNKNDPKNELDEMRITLILNKYPPAFIDQQLKRFYKDLSGEETAARLLSDDHEKYRKKTLENEMNKNKKAIDFSSSIILHFAYTPELARFGQNFHEIWSEFFEETPLNDTKAIYAYQNTENLKQLLVKKKPNDNTRN